MGKDTKAGYDIQSILTEMKDEYWQGLAETEEAHEERLECITFQLGGETYAFETVYAAEVIRMPKLVRLPRVQEIIVGVFNLRGEIMAAIDIRPLLGLPREPISTTGRIIVLKSEKFSTGLVTEGVRGVESLSVDNFEPAVKSLAGAQREFIRGQIGCDGRLVMLLDVLKLMASPEIIVNQQ
ncbi:MAG: chemotaxis protein CheW [Geobacteraceae bacterium]|nr:chemotaxis protein CheW [Geobacteraceae bacterium]